MKYKGFIFKKMVAFLILIVKENIFLGMKFMILMVKSEKKMVLE